MKKNIMKSSSGIKNKKNQISFQEGWVYLFLGGVNLSVLGGVCLSVFRRGESISF